AVPVLLGMVRLRRHSLPELLVQSKHTGMLQRFSIDLVFPLAHGCGTSRLASWPRCLPALMICWLTLGLTCKVHAQSPAPSDERASEAPQAVTCLPDGGGFLEARLSGAVQAELVWGNEG